MDLSIIIAHYDPGNHLDCLNSFQKNLTEILAQKDKYKIALGIKDPRANFMLKRLIFDESPQTLSPEDFKIVHRELHDRLVINQERPFTTIPEAMNYVDTEFSKLEDSDDEEKDKKLIILKDYNKYLLFLEKYFSNKNADPLPFGPELAKIIFG